MSGDAAGAPRPAGRGLLDPRQAEKQVRRGLAGMSGAARTAFAAAAAQRLAAAQLALPPAAHDQEVLAWRPALDAIWRGLAGDHDSAEVPRALARFYVRHQVSGPGALEGGFLTVGGSEEGSAAITATYCAAQCYLHGCADFAIWAARVATEITDHLVEQDQVWWSYKPASVQAGEWHRTHPAVQSECARQLRDLRLLADHGELLGDSRPDRLADRLRLLEALYSSDTGQDEQLHLFDGLPYFWLTLRVPGARAAAPATATTPGGPG
jgi:hypothetical protein